jgi:hypothetical protein
MNSKLWIAPILALGLVGAPAMAGGTGDAPMVKESRIPFVNHGGIRDWRFGDRDTIYVQDRHRNWYEATLMNPVVGWRGQWAIGFESRGIDTFDRFSNIVVDGWRHPVQSLVRIDGPPPRHGEDDRAEA